MLGIVVGGIGASLDVVIVAMVEGVIIGVGGLRDTIEEDPVVKMDSTPASLIGFSMLDAERFEQLVDHRHLFQTPDVRVPPSD
nr:hypothetical protein [Tanacetum cinerariifolium]